MAARYFLSGNSNSTSSWSTTDGGSSGASVPIFNDDAYFTSNSGACTINFAHTWLSVTCTGYSGGWTVSNSFAINGNCTLASAMSITGSGNLTISGGGTFTSNGKVWPNNLTVSTSGTVISGTLTVTGNVTISSNSSVLQGGTLNVGGNLTQSATINSANQTTKIVMNGTGTVSGAGYIGNDLEVNTSGTVTFSGTINLGNSSRTVTLKYTAGSTTTTSSTLNLGASCIFDTNGISWNNLTQATYTITNNSAMTVTGTYSIGSGSVNGSDVNLQGNLTITGNNAGTPSAKFVFNGTGAQAISGNFNFRNSVDVNKSSGTLTIGSFGYGTGTFRRVAGTVDHTGSTLNLIATCTLDTSGITWDAVTVNTTGTITINSLFSANTLTLPNTAATFAGTAGFTVGTLSNTTPTAARTYTLKNGVTYTVTSAFNLAGTSSFNVTLQSSVASSYAIVNLQAGANQNVQYVKTNDIDSNGGGTIFDKNMGSSNLVRTLNWNPSASGYYYFLQ